MRRRDRVAIARVEQLAFELRRLIDSPAAFRPPPVSSRPLPTDAKLAVMASAAHFHGLTEGDSLVLSLAMTSAVDRHRSYDLAFDAVYRALFVDKTITNPYGIPVASLAGTSSSEDIVMFLRSVVLMYRPESFRQFWLDTNDHEMAAMADAPEVFERFVRSTGYVGDIPPVEHQWLVRGGS